MWFKNLLPVFMYAHTYMHVCVHTNRRNIERSPLSLPTSSNYYCSVCVSFPYAYTNTYFYFFIQSNLLYILYLLFSLNVILQKSFYVNSQEALSYTKLCEFFVATLHSDFYFIVQIIMCYFLLICLFHTIFKW